MGHIHLQHLPGTKKWRGVADLLAGDATPEKVIVASAVAAEKELLGAVEETTFVEALRLLALIPQAAGTDRFGAHLRDLGLDVPNRPMLIDLALAAGHRLDGLARGRSDVPELVRRALLSTLTRRIGADLPGLFEPDAGDVQAAAAKLGRPPEFAAATRDFLGRLTGGILAAYLDRALSAHVGAGLRFRDAAARSAFDAALLQYCAEATRIVREFAGGWYGKTLYREGTITAARAAGFGAIALRKIVAELGRKRDADG